MATVRIGKEFITNAMQSPAVQGELKKKADSLASRANNLGDAEGVEMDATVRTGVRPKGRPFARVESENVWQEWGSRRVLRRRILGRVGAGE